MAYAVAVLISPLTSSLFGVRTGVDSFLIHFPLFFLNQIVEINLPERIYSRQMMKD